MECSYTANYIVKRGVRMTPNIQCNHSLLPINMYAFLMFSWISVHSSHDKEKPEYVA